MISFFAVKTKKINDNNPNKPIFLSVERITLSITMLLSPQFAPQRAISCKLALSQPILGLSVDKWAYTITSMPEILIVWFIIRVWPYNTCHTSFDESSDCISDYGVNVATVENLAAAPVFCTLYHTLYPSSCIHTVYACSFDLR